MNRPDNSYKWRRQHESAGIRHGTPDLHSGQHPSFLYPPTILGMMHHTWSAIVVVLMFMEGYLKLTYKKWYCTLFGFTCYLAYGAFLMCVLKYSNPFYMTAPAIDGTIFTAWVMAPIYIVVYALILLAVELARKHKNRSASVIS